MFERELQKSLILEMLNPSPDIYFFAPISQDMKLFDDSMQQFTDLFPLSESKIIYFSDVIHHFSWKDANVYIMLDLHEKDGETFFRKLREYRNVSIAPLDSRHMHGLFTHRIALKNWKQIISGKSLVDQHLKVAREQWGGR
jgi:hypothetical protein